MRALFLAVGVLVGLFTHDTVSSVTHRPRLAVDGREPTAASRFYVRRPLVHHRHRRHRAGKPSLQTPVPAGTSSPSKAQVDVAWVRLVRCEASGDWHISSGNGFYGGPQFTMQTWGAYGGNSYASDPSNATVRQQVIVGCRVLADQGVGAWPVCGPRTGLNGAACQN